jgi:hypothetical protein
MMTLTPEAAISVNECMHVSFLSRSFGKDKKRWNRKSQKTSHLRQMLLLPAYLIRILNKRRPLHLGPRAHVNTATFAVVACLMVPVCGERFDLS